MRAVVTLVVKYSVQYFIRRVPTHVQLSASTLVTFNLPATARSTVTVSIFIQNTGRIYALIFTFFSTEEKVKFYLYEGCKMGVTKL